MSLGVEQLWVSAATLLVMSMVPKMLEALGGLLKLLELDSLLKRLFTRQYKYSLELECTETLNRAGHHHYSDHFFRAARCMQAIRAYLAHVQAESASLQWNDQKAVPVGTVTHDGVVIRFASSHSQTEGTLKWSSTMTLRTNRSKQHLVELVQRCLAWHDAEEARVREPYFWQQKPMADGSATRWLRYPIHIATTWEQLLYPERAELQRAVEQLQPTQKLVLLLHGPPGTGKTSTVRAIASATGRHIVNVDLALTANNQELMSILFGSGVWVSADSGLVDRPTADQCIFVFEEIDTQLETLGQRHAIVQESEKSEKKDKCDLASVLKVLSERLTLGGLLTVLDGILELHNAIVVMTTNHVEKLDPRLIRAGRVTHQICLGALSADDAAALVQRKYPSAERRALQCLGNRPWLPADLAQLVARSASLEQLIERLQ